MKKTQKIYLTENSCHTVGLLIPSKRCARMSLDDDKLFLLLIPALMPKHFILLGPMVFFDIQDDITVFETIISNVEVTLYFMNFGCFNNYDFSIDTTVCWAIDLKDVFTVNRRNNLSFVI